MTDKTFSTFYLAGKQKQLLCERPHYAYIFYKDFRLNLLTGEREDFSLKDLFGLLDLYKIDSDYPQPVVIHLFFELGFYCVDLEESIDSSKPLALIIKYKDFSEKELFSEKQDQPFSLELLSSPSLEKYAEKFKKVYEHLSDGDCYQVNLTMPFYFRMKSSYSPKEFLTQLWRKPEKISDYSHGTFIDSLNKMFLSNSPECLFMIEESEERRLVSLPVKGTEKCEDTDKASIKRAEEKLLSSGKNEAELFMIADLMRNDLTKIEMFPARIDERKSLMKVPDLVHQYSRLSVPLSNECRLSDIIKAIFPGGSITGAPKKKVMEIIGELEVEARGFYCGSTILLSSNIKAASINIRSLEIDYADNELKYGAGGGLTLLSRAEEEYDEMIAKLESFLHLLS